jgi:ketosteroid isomerase-like protein
VSREHVENIRRAIAAFNAGDVDELRDTFTPEPSITPLRAALETGTVYSGPGAVDQFWTAAQEDWVDARIEIESIETVGEQVLVIGHYSGRTRKSEIPFTQRIGMVADFEGGKTSQMQTYVDPGDAHEAVGLSE